MGRGIPVTEASIPELADTVERTQAVSYSGETSRQGPIMKNSRGVRERSERTQRKTVLRDSERIPPESADFEVLQICESAEFASS